MLTMLGYFSCNDFNVIYPLVKFNEIYTELWSHNVGQANKFFFFNNIKKIHKRKK